MKSDSHKTKRIIGSILLAIPTVFLLYSGFGKITGAPAMTTMFDVLGIDAYRVALGIVEMLIAVLLWIPRTHRIALLLTSSFLGGAFASELILGSSGLFAGSAILLVWLGSRLKYGWCGCHACAHGGENCPDCHSGTCSIHHDQCNCKPGCNCKKGFCSC